MGLTAVVALVDPSDHSVLPPCPIYTTTGLYCPGCGLTRAAHAFLNGQVSTGLGYNLLAPAIYLLLVALWWSWLQVARHRPAPRWERLPRTLWMACGAAVVAFTVLRNVPAFSALAP